MISYQNNIFFQKWDNKLKSKGKIGNKILSYFFPNQKSKFLTQRNSMGILA